MKSLLVSVAMGVGALLCQGAYAQEAAAHTALCKDGTYFDGTTHKGACKGHQGVKEWMDKTAAKSTTAAAAPAAASDDTATTKKTKKAKKAAAAEAAAPAAAPAPAKTAAAPAPAATAATTKEKHETPTPAKDIVQKPGGGAGLVWVNTNTKVYHCPGDEWYGKTKEGSYMSAADAEKAGAHASGGKACK